MAQFKYVPNKLLIFALATISVYAALWCTRFRPLLPGYHSLFYTSKNYVRLCAHESSACQQLAFSANDTGSQSAFDTQLQTTITNEYLPYWLGTHWNFNGTTSSPGCGSIACGYFVTTILQHSGAKIDRVHLAQLPSESMINELVEPTSVAHHNRVSYEDFISQLKKNGPALYVIGLDNHTGLIEVSDDVYFIHASGRFPFCVIKEEAKHSPVLKKSAYKVTGRLTGDKKFMHFFCP